MHWIARKKHRRVVRSDDDPTQWSSKNTSQTRCTFEIQTPNKSQAGGCQCLFRTYFEIRHTVTFSAGHLQRCLTALPPLVECNGNLILLLAHFIIMFVLKPSPHGLGPLPCCVICQNHTLSLEGSQLHAEWLPVPQDFGFPRPLKTSVLLPSVYPFNPVLRRCCQVYLHDPQMYLYDTASGCPNSLNGCCQIDMEKLRW